MGFIALVLMLRYEAVLYCLITSEGSPILGGYPFAYLGSYMVGTLPFSEPCSRLQEVFRQHRRFMVITLTIVPGQQSVGSKIAHTRNKRANLGGKIFYWLVMGWILAEVLFTLGQLVVRSESH